MTEMGQDISRGHMKPEADKLRDHLEVDRRIVVQGVAVLLVASPVAALAGDQIEDAKMEKVTGIGGFFFRARDPGGLADWYLRNLGVALVPQSYDSEPWRTEAGVTIFAPFEQASELFGSPDKHWMINFRVRSLDAMATQLRANGISVEIDPEIYPNGRFAKLSDPEGNPIQLWEPKA